MYPSEIIFVSSFAHHPRLRFVVDTIFCLWGGWSVQYSTSWPSEIPKGLIVYPYEPKDSSWLTAPLGKKLTLDELDSFGKIFYGLSLWEKYLEIPRDKHGRQQENALPSVQAGWHESPFIHEVLLESTLTPGLLPRPDFFRFETTVDVDQVFRFRGKPRLISWLGLLRDLLKFRFREVTDRINVWRGMPDPYELTWNHILSRQELPVKVFFLQGEHPQMDSRFKFSAPEYSELIQSLIGNSVIPGLHPSYYTSAQPELLALQLAQLEYVTRTPVRISRQHYLKSTLPETYRELEKLGIQEEHSTAFYSQPGFFCGTTLPFYWYDLRLERTSSMMIYPAVIMDRSLCQYIEGSPEEKAGIARRYRDICKSHGIPFRVILHHEAFAARDEWKGFEEMLEVLTGIRP